jgi:hypothetical protein
VLRRYENKAVSMLPNDPNEQRKFAVRLGYREFNEFRRDYVEARDAIHALYNRRMRKSEAAPARRASHPPSRSFGVAGSEAATEAS